MYALQFLFRYKSGTSHSNTHTHTQYHRHRFFLVSVSRSLNVVELIVRTKEFLLFFVFVLPIFSLTLSLSRFNGNFTVKCVVHFYDMLHLFGKAKHILYNVPHPLSPDLSTSIKIFVVAFFLALFSALLHIVALIFHFSCQSILSLSLCVF